MTEKLFDRLDTRETTSAIEVNQTVLDILNKKLPVTFSDAAIIIDAFLRQPVVQENIDTLEIDRNNKPLLEGETTEDVSVDIVTMVAQKPPEDSVSLTVMPGDGKKILLDITKDLKPDEFLISIGVTNEGTARQDANWNKYPMAELFKPQLIQGIAETISGYHEPTEEQLIQEWFKGDRNNVDLDKQSSLDALKMVVNKLLGKYRANIDGRYNTKSAEEIVDEFIQKKEVGHYIFFTIGEGRYHLGVEPNEDGKGSKIFFGGEVDEKEYNPVKFDEINGRVSEKKEEIIRYLTAPKEEGR